MTSVSNRKVEEVEFVLSTGQIIAGKWWGDRSIRPFLCIHGWMDNAATFDRLIPLLPDEYSYLAIDLPGHGLSSHYPAGAHYDNLNYLAVVGELHDQLKWPKISFLCHSLGGWVAYIYTSIFPNTVDVLITIDTFKLFDVPIDDQLEIMGITIKKYRDADKQFREKIEPPSYTFEEIVEKISGGSMGNITKESARYLAIRHVKESAKNPGKYYFSRDGRVRFTHLFELSEELMTGMATKISIPFLFFRNLEAPFFRNISYEDNLVKALKKQANFCYELVDLNSHFFHLNDPEKVAPKISDFIRKHRKISSHL